MQPEVIAQGVTPLPTNAYAAILAGGSGTRMGNPDKPKQFLMLGDKPVLAHTLEKFCVSGLFDAVLVLVPPTWQRQTLDVVHHYCPQFESLVRVVAGGSTRNDTVARAIEELEARFPVDDETIIVTHDAVRPFVTHRIIVENIEAARATGACDTVVPCTDTIVESTDAALVTAIPNRRNLYQGQTPQSFNLRELERLLESLSPSERASLTDACKICVLRGRPVSLVTGDPSNMKITYPQDMRLACALLEA